MPARLRRFSTLGFALGLALFAGACDSGDTKHPDGDGGAEGGPGAAAPAEGGKDYVYAAEGFTLTATTKVKTDLSSSQGQGTAEISATSLLEVTATPDGKLQIHGKVLELGGYEGTGQLDPEFMRKQAEEQGQEAFDMVAELASSETWAVVDNKGETDKDASEALAQNQGNEDSASADFGLFELPSLPSVDLEVGKKVTLPTETKDRQLPFGAVPVERDVSWTLRGVNGTIAELDVSSEGSGATEIDTGQGTGLVSVLEEASFTILFDLEAKVPVSFSGYSASEISVDAGGQSFQFATNNELETTFVVGGSAPAEEAPAEAAPTEAAPAEAAPAGA